MRADQSAATDDELVAAARTGDADAYAQLYRRHAGYAAGLARSLTQDSSQADDLVSEAFANILQALTRGAGPRGAFRPYLTATIRHALYNAARKGRRVRPSDDLADLDDAVPFTDTPVAAFEAHAVAAAFASLPPRWQETLWRIDIHGERTYEAAAAMGTSPNAMAALTGRAREALRTAYLQAHLAAARDLGCRDTVQRLGAHARGTLSRRDQQKVDLHLSDCRRCAALAEELSELSSSMRALLLPLLIAGPPAVGRLAPGRTRAGIGSARPASTGYTTVARWSARRALAGLAATAAAVVTIAGSAPATADPPVLADAPARIGAPVATATPGSPPPAVVSPAASASPADADPQRPGQTPEPVPSTTTPSTITPSMTAPAADAPAAGSPLPVASERPQASGPAVPAVPTPAALDPSPPSASPSTPTSPSTAAIKTLITVVYADGSHPSYQISLAGDSVDNGRPRLHLDGAPVGWTTLISGGCGETQAYFTCTLAQPTGVSSYTLTLTPPAGQPRTEGTGGFGLYSDDINQPPADSVAIAFS